MKAEKRAGKVCETHNWTICSGPNDPDIPCPYCKIDSLIGTKIRQAEREAMERVFEAVEERFRCHFDMAFVTYVDRTPPKEGLKEEITNLVKDLRDEMLKE